MHPRNRYHDAKPDFQAYATTRPSLAPHLIQRKSPTAEGFLYTINFGDPDALRELTCACLEHDFGLQVSIPPGHLVPIVPQKLNYIHWLEDLLASDGKSKSPLEPGQVHGIDVGTGASCIYPLLSARMNGWRFLATEVCPESVKCAQENVARNGLQELITVMLVPSDTVLAGAVDKSPLLQYSFCMCNPPFFSSMEERQALKSRTGRRPPPLSLPTGNECETIVDGGEVELVKRMISDSVQLGNKIRWYSSLLGKKASMKVLRAELKDLGVPVVTTTTFVQGKTHRWGLAWSFDHTLNPQVQVRTASKCQLCFHLELAPFPANSTGLAQALDWIQDLLRGLEIDYGILFEEVCCVQLSCKAVRNTWSHQRKRRRLRLRLAKLSQQTGSGQSGEDVGPVTMATGQTAEPQEESQNLVGQLEELSAPCRMEFQLRVSIGEGAPGRSSPEPPSTKRMKGEGTEANSNSERCVMATLEFVSGDTPDQLHQIMQYFKNQLSSPLSTVSPLPPRTTS